MDAPPEVTLDRTQVDLAGLLQLLGKSLYTSPEVAVRELVQNAHDACTRRQLESRGGFEAWIRVLADPVQGRLIVEDGGAGLTREEIRSYLATVGAGYTRRLREASEDASLIGQFGVGFMTAFVISERVDVYTTSFQAPDTGWHFVSRGGEQYTIRPHPARPPGMRIELKLRADHMELAQPATLRRIVQRYCGLLDVPLYVGTEGKDDSEQVNADVPPWRLRDQISSIRKKKLELEFAARHEPLFEPITTFGFGTDAGEAGLVWIQDGGSYATSDHRHVSVYVRGMMVTQDARDMLPPWAGFVGAVVESRRLAPTASREDLQRDEAYDQVSAALQSCLVEGLKRVAREEPRAWSLIRRRHNEALLGAAVAEPALIEALADELTVPTTEGDLRLQEIRSRSGGKMHLSVGESTGPESVLFQALGVPIIQGSRFAAAPFASRWADARSVPLIKIGTEAGNREIFPEADIEPESAERLRRLFETPGERLCFSRFQPIDLPLVVLPDREAELKLRIESDEAERRIATAALGLARLHTAKLESEVTAYVYVNLNCAIIRELQREHDPSLEAAASVVSSFARLSQRVGDHDQFQASLRQLTDGIQTLLQRGSD